MHAGRLIERLLQLVPVLLGVSLIVFVMMTLTPGDPVEIMIGDQQITPEQEETLRRDMGLDLPPPQRFLNFIGNALTGDFGLSFFHRRPVADVIGERLPATIELTLVSLILALLVSIPLGVIAAVHKNGLIDRLATVGSLLGVSLPGFWFGILLILFFAVNLQLVAGFAEMPGRLYQRSLNSITGHPASGRQPASTARLRCRSEDALAAHHPARGHTWSADGVDIDARNPRIDAGGA